MRPNTHQCREASNSSRLHPFGRHGNISERSSKFEKIPMFQCIRPNDVVISARHQSKYEENQVFLCRHVYGKTATSVRTTGLHYSNAILDKARRGEELQPFGRQGNTVQTLVLIMVIAYSKGATVQTLGQHRLDAALFKKAFQRFMESRLHSSPSGRP
jgi:hypothetical protein